MASLSDFSSLIRPLPAGVTFSDDSSAQELIEAGVSAQIAPMPTPDAQDVFGIYLPSNTRPWMALNYPNGQPIVCRGVRIGVNNLSWSPNGGVTTYTTLCPEGNGNAGAGWAYRFCPRYTLVVGIGGIQCDKGDRCGNPRDVYSVNGHAGQLTIAFNDSAGPGGYNDNTGGGTVMIYAVYQ
jgi:hypothetical protein